MPAPLILTESELVTHFRAIGEILSAAVDVTVKVQINVDWDLSPIVGGLLGEGCEYVTRNRGLRVPVAPLLHLQQGLWAWLGYREEWANERPGRRMRRFSFRTIGMTVHFGWKNDVFKPQMFRAEWAGWARWGSANYGFQAADAGHPHWQFDALESLPAIETVERARELREILDGVLSRSVLEFDWAFSGWLRVLDQAARSIGVSASSWVRVCHPSTLRIVI